MPKNKAVQEWAALLLILLEGTGLMFVMVLMNSYDIQNRLVG